MRLRLACNELRKASRHPAYSSASRTDRVSRSATAECDAVPEPVKEYAFRVNYPLVGPPPVPVWLRGKFNLDSLTKLQAIERGPARDYSRSRSMMSIIRDDSVARTA